MNAKQAVNEIKAVLSQFGIIPAPAKASFKLEDNTILQAEKLEVGKAIEKINEDFQLTPLENGSYKLQEGFTIEVLDGVLSAVNQAFLDAKLIDGTQIKVEGEELIEGAKVIVVTEDAEVPAPDGIHELEDKTKVETKDGLIVKIEEAVEASPEGGEPVEEVVPSGDLMDPEMVEMVQMMKEFVRRMDEKMSGMQKKMESMQSDFNAFKKEPIGKKISDGKTDFNKINDISDADAIVANIMKLRNSK